MNALVWGIEWRLAVADKRALALGALLPFVLVEVFYTGGLPVGPGCAACVALFVTLAVLRTSLPLLRDERSGLAARVMRGGVSSSSYLLQRAAAGTGIVLLSLLPALAVIAVAERASAMEVSITVAALAGTLWIASLLGVLLAAVARTTSEMLLVSAVLLILLLHMSGVFHTPSPDGLGAFFEAAAPFRVLHESFLQMSSGTAVGGGLAVAAWAVLLPTAVGLLAPRVLGDVRAAG